ncbi:EAL domain-containing protein [Cohnella suwonensis]|uniref:EAL domain-containing protein n=1 Tax=Cohnella suwonensis TaxID=696072 RepID=A0ABW0LX24_9BACL
MAQGYRIGVIAPYLDGEYYGRLLPHIHEAVKERNSELFAIQVADDELGVVALEEPVSFDLVDAWILILPSASAAFLEMLANGEKPFVCIGFPSPYPRGGSVLVSNRESMKEAVLHLIDHGHRGIAFIGHTQQYDLHERYNGYLDALAERGIEADERLAVRAADNLLESGKRAAERLLATGVPFSAVAAGTDLNALGAIDYLNSRGYSVPDDFAVIGYDDIHQAGLNYPPLTTVGQPFREMGRKAVSKAFDLIAGRKPEAAETFVPAGLVVRKSCGCEESRSLASKEGLDFHMNNLSKMRIALHNVTVNNYKMTQGLIVATKDEKIHISKLFWSVFHWGCLALWEEDGKGGRRLVVRQTFSKRGDRVPPAGLEVPLERFPPVEYLPPGAGPGGEEFVVLHPVRSELQNWGYIALVGPLDPMDDFVANDLSRHSFTILAVALERELLFKQVSSMAEKLEIVSRTTNDGIWDWDLTTDKIEWTIRAHHMMSGATERLLDTPQAFVDLVHPDDQLRLRLEFMRPFQKDRPIQVELRFRTTDGQHLWLFLAGDILYDESGMPIRIIGSITDVTEKKTNEERITQLAYQDALTGLPNRLRFKDQLRQAMAERDLDGGRLAVLMIDLDRFKIVNDTLGHQSGDCLLQRAAHMLRDCVGEDDIIARLGGDEFIVLLKRIEGVGDVSSVTKKMLDALAQPFILEGQSFHLSASIGASLYPTECAEAEANPDTLIRDADLAMYHTKENGGNRFEIYEPALSSKRVERFNMENGLRYAQERGELTLHFQPQISLSTGKVYGAETLLRWNAPGGETIQPGEFIPLAEETGLIVPIGQWVLEQACAECKRWIRAGMPQLVISVNISALQFEQDDFPDLVRRVLERTGIEPYNLCLEITEHTAVQNMEHSVKMLHQLIDIGVKIAIDDFGIGQSSLLWLKKLPAHIVKIDPAFILNMIEDSDDDAIAKAVIVMSHNLGLSVTAEGVETEQQLQRLQQLQCDRIQGFYTGRPMTSDQFIAYFLEIHSWASS